VIQGRGGPRLLHEPLDAARIARQVGRQDLDGQIATERRVPGAIHLAHAARANPPGDFVSSDSGTDHGRILPPDPTAFALLADSGSRSTRVRIAPRSTSVYAKYSSGQCARLDPRRPAVVSDSIRNRAGIADRKAMLTAMVTG
jgi:hypothetical protein